MLQHVREAQILELVFRGVNLLVGILEVGLDHKSRGIPGLGRRGVVRACVPALCQDVGDLAVLQMSYQLPRCGWVVYMCVGGRLSDLLRRENVPR